MVVADMKSAKVKTTLKLAREGLPLRVLLVEDSEEMPR